MDSDRHDTKEIRDVLIQQGKILVAATPRQSGDPYDRGKRRGQRGAGLLAQVTREYFRSRRDCLSLLGIGGCGVQQDRRVRDSIIEVLEFRVG